MTRSQAAIEQSRIFARLRAERAPRRDAELVRARAAVTLPAVMKVPGGFVMQAAPPPGFVDITCHHADEVHRVEVGDSEIPFAICPHDGQRETAFVDSWSENARASYALFVSVLNERYRDGSGHVLDIVPAVTREIDARPAEPLRGEDLDWGESDSLENIPRRGEL